MTLGELIHQHREAVADDAIGLRRSWEDTYRYTLRHYPQSTALDDFNLDDLTAKLIADGVNAAFIDGYIKRWRVLLAAINHH